MRPLRWSPSRLSTPGRPSRRGPGEPAAARAGGGVRLLLAAALGAACWLVALPLLGRLPAIRRHIDRNEALGVDPSAKFYSELPAMPEILDRLEARRRQSPAAFLPDFGGPSRRN